METGLVCGIIVEKRTAKETAPYQGTHYFFCSARCLRFSRAAHRPRGAMLGTVAEVHDPVEDVAREELPALLTYWLSILVAYLVVTVGRGLVIVAGRALVGLTGERFPWRWTVVLTWGGLRGVLPMVLALSLLATFV